MLSACTAPAGNQDGGGFDPFALLWYFVILSSLVPLFRKSWLDMRRRALFGAVQDERKSRVITLITARRR